jgi:periplasmic protein TonB
MRLYTLVVSIVAHTAVLIVLVIVPLVAMDALPAARGIKEFIRADAAELPEPPPPPRPRSPEASTQDANPNVAPIEAPATIEPEPPDVVRGVPIDGPPGVEGGVPGGVPLPGLAPSLPPPPQPVKPLVPGGDIRVPQKIRHVAPIYPSIARANGVEGVVILEAVIGENGRVKNVRVLRSIQLLDQAAVDAVRQWQFTPTLLNGQPVPVVMTVTVSFELK